MPNNTISMKKIIIIAIVFFSIQIAAAQEPTNGSDNTVYNTAGIDVKPEYPGGYEEFYKFIAKNYKTPNVAGLKGKVYVTFVIEKDGSITGIKILRDIGYGTGKEAIRVLELCPKWAAGEQNGQKVRCTFSLPIAIQS
jgi:protein TonB